MGMFRIGTAALIVVVGSSWSPDRQVRADEKTAPLQASDESTELRVQDITSRPPAAQRIYDRLDRPAQLQFQDRTLNDALGTIADTHGIHIVMDQRAVEKLGEAAKRPFSIDATDVPLRKALQWLFDGRFIDYYVDENVLRITHRDDVLARQEIRIYDVQPLLKDGATGQDVADLLNSGRLLKNSPKAQPIGGLVTVAGNRHVHDSVLRRLRSTDAEEVLVFRAEQDPFPRGRR